MITSFDNYINESSKYEESIKISDILEKFTLSRSKSRQKLIEELNKLFLSKKVDIEYSIVGLSGLLKNKTIIKFYFNTDGLYVGFEDGYITDVHKNDIYHIKEPKRIFNEIDPYGEEDWNVESVGVSFDFKVGDKVRCIDNNYYEDILSKNKIYVITNSNDQKRFSNLRIQVKEFGGKRKYLTHFCADRFIPYDEEEFKRKLKRQEELRLKMIDVDPYGEEDWLEESANYKFKIGDKVIVKDNYCFKEFVNKVGEIVFEENYSLLVKFETRFSDHQHNGNSNEYVDYEHKSRWFYPDEIELYDPVEIEKRLKEIEELRLKYKDIDPYGEEDWLEEAFDGEKKKKKRVSEDIQIGDRVIYHFWIDGFPEKSFGTVIDKKKQGKNLYRFSIRFDETSGKYSPLFSGKYLYILGDNLEKLSKEEEEEIKRKEEIKKERKERMRLKMIDIDPYGEEEWD